MLEPSIIEPKTIKNYKSPHNRGLYKLNYDNSNYNKATRTSKLLLKI